MSLGGRGVTGGCPYVEGGHWRVPLGGRGSLEGVLRWEGSPEGVLRWEGVTGGYP